LGRQANQGIIRDCVALVGEGEGKGGGVTGKRSRRSKFFLLETSSKRKKGGYVVQSAGAQKKKDFICGEEDIARIAWEGRF